MNSEELDPRLISFVKDGPLGKMIHHPLIIEIFYSKEMAGFINQRYRQKEKDIALATYNKDYRKYIFLHERPYRANALSEVLQFIDSKDYWDVLSSVYIDTENYHQNKSFWNFAFESTIEVPDDFKLSEPSTFKVYRGFQKKGAERGISWTLDKDKAIWFANRFKDGTPQLAETEIDKTKVVCYLKSRGEEEVIIHPHELQNLNIKISKVTNSTQLKKNKF